MKRKFFLPIFVVIILLINDSRIYASSQSTDLSEDMRQAQIEQIFSEINMLTAEQANYEFMKSKGLGDIYSLSKAKNNNLFSESQIDTLSSCEDKIKALEQDLEDLGVHKIDTSDKEDLQLLNEMSSNERFGDSTSGRSGIYDTAPNLSAIASIYTLYIYDGKVTRNNKDYYYRYIKVVDNKGYNGLTHNQEFNAIGNLNNSQLLNILEYNFGYLLSTLMSSTPVGLVTNWTLGNIFNVINNSSSGQIASTGQPIYRIFHSGVTSMTYYYIYNSGWKMVGVGASANIIRDDYFAGNVNGVPKTDYHTVSFSTKTSGIWSDYINNYIDNMSANPNYCLVKEIGSFTVKGYSNNISYAPAYARNPSDLI